MSGAFQLLPAVLEGAAAFMTGGASLATAPFLEGAGIIGGAADQYAQQSQAQKAAAAAQGNEQGLLQQAVAQSQNPVPLLNAEHGANETLKSNIGGVANPGAVIKSLYGNDLASALNATLQNSTGTELAAAQGYGGIAKNASAALGSGNPYASAAGAAFNALTRTGKPTGPTGTATGLGSAPTDPGGGYIFNPNNAPNVLDPSSGFIPQTVSA